MYVIYMVQIFHHFRLSNKDLQFPIIDAEENYKNVSIVNSLSLPPPRTT